MKKTRKRNKYLNIFYLAIAIMIAYRIILGNSNIFTWIKGFIKILSPLWGGLALAYILYIPEKKLENKILKSKSEKIRKWARAISVGVVYIVFFLIVVIAFRFLIPFAITNIKELIINVPEYLENAKNFFNEHTVNIFSKEYNLAPKIAELQKINITDMILSKFSVENVFKGVSQVADLVKWAIGTFALLLISIYVLYGRDKLKAALEKLLVAMFDKKVTDKIFDYIKLTNYMVYKYVIAQLLDGIIISVLMSIAFSILKVKYAIPLGILIGISNLIPYFSVIGISVAIIITVFTSGIKGAFIVAIVALIIQQVDANVINPYIVGKSLNTMPIVTILTILVASNFFGPLGIFLSIPIVTVIIIIISDLLDEKVRKQKIKKLTTPRKKIHLIAAKDISGRNYTR